MHRAIERRVVGAVSSRGLAAAMLFACAPKVYPGAEPEVMAAVEAEPRATAALEARSTMEVTADAGAMLSNAGAGSTRPDASSGGSNSRDQSTAVAVGRGGVFVGGDNNGVIKCFRTRHVSLPLAIPRRAASRSITTARGARKQILTAASSWRRPTARDGR